MITNELTQEKSVNNLPSASNGKPTNLNPDWSDLTNPETFKKEITTLKHKASEAKENKGLFKVMTANEWLELAKKSPVPEMLFGEFWHEGEICILF